MQDSMTGGEGERRASLVGEAADLWLRLQAAPADEALREEVRQWRGRSAAHERAFAAAEQTWMLSGVLADAPPGEGEPPAIPAMRSRQSYRTAGRQAARRSRMRRLAVGLAGAAAVAGVAVFAGPGLSLMWQSDYRTGTGETRTVALADGTSVTLDTGSAIALDYGGGHRGVRLLAGRAWFDVARDEAHPFTVAVADARVTVTGTAFDVGLAEDAIDVALAHGGVRVDWDGGEPVALTPGDVLHLARPSYEAASGRAAVSSMGSWRRGRLLLEDVALADGIDQLRRYYSGAIVLTSSRLGSRRVTGVFDVADPDEALRLMVRQHGATVREVTPWLLIVSGG